MATIDRPLQTAKMIGVDLFARLAQTLQCIAVGSSNRALDHLLTWHPSRRSNSYLHAIVPMISVG